MGKNSEDETPPPPPPPPPAPSPAPDPSWVKFEHVRKADPDDIEHR